MSIERIISIKKINKNTTLDIEVNTNDHVFYANGIACSNSHSICYALNGYWTAYLKTHFPLVFFGSWLLGANWKNADKYEEIAELVNDAKLHNIDVRIPKLYSITRHMTIINNEYIQFGLTEIKGIGDTTSKKIINLLNDIEKDINKDRKEWTWTEFLLFVSEKMGKKAVIALISIGALDYMDKSTRNRKLFEYEQYSQLSGQEPEWLRNKYYENKWSSLQDALISLSPVRKIKNKIQISGGGTSNINRERKVKSIISVLQNPPTKHIDTIEWIALNEENYLGTPITMNKVDGCEESYEANITCREFIEGKNLQFMALAVEIVNIDIKKTRGGKTPGAKMARLTIRDSTASIDAVVFPKEWQTMNNTIYKGSTVLAIAQKNKDGGLCIKKIREIA
jgi:DNA polymerase III alpha subunit